MTFYDWFAIATCFMLLSTLALLGVDCKHEQDELDRQRQREVAYRLELDRWRRNGCKGPRPIKP